MSGRTLTRRYLLLTALRWFPVGLIVPVLVITQQARGFDLATIGLLGAVYSATVLLLELPTGGLADVIGRRPVVIASSLVTAASMALLGLASDVAVVAAAVALNGAGRALGSGPLDAWYVDALHADDPDAELRGGISSSWAAESVGLAVGAVIGGALPAAAGALTDLPTSGDEPLLTFSVTWLVAAALMGVHAVVAWRLVHETPRPRVGARSLLRDVPMTIRRGTRLAVSDSVVRRLSLRMALVGVALAGLELLTPLHLIDLQGSSEAGSSAYGILSAIGFVGTTVGALMTPRVGRWARPTTSLVIGGLVAAPLALTIASPVLGVTSVSYVLVYTAMGAVGPLAVELLHHRVKADQRSTLLSVESLALMLGGLVASLVLGVLAQATSVTAAFVPVAIALAGTGLLCLRMPTDRAQVSSATTQPT